jgi:hypothetical protein
MRRVTSAYYRLSVGIRYLRRKCQLTGVYDTTQAGNALVLTVCHIRRKHAFVWRHRPAREPRMLLLSRRDSVCLASHPGLRRRPCASVAAGIGHNDRR